NRNENGMFTARLKPCPFKAASNCTITRFRSGQAPVHKEGPQGMLQTTVYGTSAICGKIAAVR
ncbi:MAG: hypothetical protein WBW12_16855, partial [Terriglobales bacterium]